MGLLHQPHARIARGRAHGVAGFLYQQGFVNMSMGYAAAMAWVLLGIIAAFTAVNFFLSRYWVFYQDAG